jgi:hypothetical protein
MALTLLAALRKLADVQETLTISDPLPMSMARVFAFPPDRSQALADLPCVINTWRFDGIERGASGRRLQRYAIRCQFFLGESSISKAAEIAAAFHDAWVAAIDRNTRLGGTATQVDQRGADPTLALLEWAGKGHVGLDEYLDLTLVDAVEYA